VQVPPHVATAAAARAVLGILAGELAYAGLQLSCYGAEALAAAIELECIELGTTGLGADRTPCRG
jgi:hypothetical protein